MKNGFFYRAGLAIHFLLITALIISTGFNVGMYQWALAIASMSWGLGLFVALFSSKIATAAASNRNDKIDNDLIVMHKNSKKYNGRGASDG